MARLQRRASVARLLAGREGLLVVAGLGATAWDISAAGDRPLNFPTWGGMGNAAMIGLGLSLAQPDRRVLVLTGDGEMLMGLGALATIAVARPANLAVVVIDNERYGETGMQETHTAHGVDLVGVARAAGIGETTLVTDAGGLDRLAQRLDAPGLFFAIVKVAAAAEPFALPPKDGHHLKTRFRLALLGSKGAV